MPCWYFEKKEIHSSPSSQDGLDPMVEFRYRREGARLILDAGTKMGLRYDTCATGVVYFHRFYMLHSFKMFNRYLMGACCLFLAGKVEETPKKCKDIIRIVQQLLKPEAFALFGEDPREEVMTLERVLLQTIKFDLQVEHPYSFLLSFAKQIKGDKGKIQRMTQMSWTFINDSLCTTLCLQWEPEIIAVSLMYLASRLSKFDPSDWHGRRSGSRSRWWEDLIEGLTMELMEDVCHQVLDLYSAQQGPNEKEVSPPPSSASVGEVQTPASTPEAAQREIAQPPHKTDSSGDCLPKAPNKTKKTRTEQIGTTSTLTSSKPVLFNVPPPPPAPDTVSPDKLTKSSGPPPPPPPPTMTTAGDGNQLAKQISQSRTVNQYVSSHSSSFMSTEGQQSIQTLLGEGGRSSSSVPQSQQQCPGYPQQPPTPSQYAADLSSAYNNRTFQGYSGPYIVPYSGSYSAQGVYPHAPSVPYSPAPPANTAIHSTPYHVQQPPYGGSVSSGPEYHYTPNAPPPILNIGYGGIGHPSGHYSETSPMMAAPHVHPNRSNPANLAQVRQVSHRGEMM